MPFQNYPDPCGRGLKVMLHETIRSDDFLRNTVLPHCCDIVSDSYNIVSTLQRLCCANIRRCESSHATSHLKSFQLALVMTRFHTFAST